MPSTQSRCDSRPGLLRCKGCPGFLVIVLGILSLTSGCQRESATSDASQGGSISSTQPSSLETNAAVWRPEILAREHERVFVKLADDLRRATLEDKPGVLAGFPFDQLLLPRAVPSPDALPLGIQRQRFDFTQLRPLAHQAWERAIEQFARSGGTLSQLEWSHERFVPPTNDSPAQSEFAFELHGEQRETTNRFIVQGTIAVEWAPMPRGATSSPPADLSSNLASSSNSALPKPRRLGLRELSILERSGVPGFSNHLLIAPEPERPDGTVNLHPLIVADLDRDGDEDILLPGVNQALLNNGRAEFQPVTFIQPELFYSLREAGVLADFDGDGELDYLGVAGSGPMTDRLVLYRGRADFPWNAAALPAWEQQRSDWPTNQIRTPSVLTAGDIDGDGDLDIWLGQYKPPYLGGQLPTPYYDANDGHASYLLLNDGHGRFAPGLAQPALAAKNHRRVLAASLVDLDNDGDLDLVTLNDFSGVDLFYNDGKGQFTDETARLSNRQLFGMGHAVADFNRDGALDLLAIGMSIPTVRRLDAMNLRGPDASGRTLARTAMGYGNRLFLSADHKWVEPDWDAALARTGWSWGTSALDLDNDGALDIYIANGHVSGASSEDYDSHYWTHDIYVGSSREDAALQRHFDVRLRGLNTGKTSWHGYEHNALFLDLGSNHYQNVAFLFGVAHETDCRAVVTADLNRDGRPDLLVTEAQWLGSPHRLRHRLLIHLNQLQTPHHWIGVDLHSTARGVSPIGAKVWVETGTHTAVAQVITGDSFQAQHPATIHFGLGNTEPVEQLRVRWPDGKIETLSQPAIDRYHRVVR